MQVWALIIAIEDYPDVKLAKNLPGTNKAAETFRNWVINVKNAQPANIISCAGDSCTWRTRGTTRTDIGKALDQLVSQGRDKVDELYVYFSGHGIGFDDDPNAPVIDILIGS